MAANLTVKQEQFVHKYFELGDASKAYRAVYDTKAADNVVHVNACKLLKNTKVALKIDELKKIHEKKHEVTVGRVIQEVSRLAFFDARKIYDSEGNPKPINELDDDTAAAIAGFEMDTETEHVRKINEDGEDETDEIQQTITRTRKIKLADKHGALVTLARHLGMFDKDNVKKVTGDKDNPVVVKIDAGAELAEVMTLEQLEEIQRRVIAKSQSG